MQGFIKPNAISAAYSSISAQYPHLSAQDGLFNLTWGGLTLPGSPLGWVVRAETAPLHLSRRRELPTLLEHFVH